MKSSLRRRLSLAAASAMALALLAAMPALADRWFPPAPRVFASEDGKLGFKIFPVDPAKEGEAFGDNWQGRLFRVAEDGSDQTVWQARLACPPVGVVISDQGAVACVDAWGQMGRAHSLVIHSAEDGKIVADLNIDDFLTEEEIGERVTETPGSRLWSGNASFAFLHGTGQFAVTMDWGATINVSLEDGSVSR
jgi:hypothetical protein